MLVSFSKSFTLFDSQLKSTEKDWHSIHKIVSHLLGIDDGDRKPIANNNTDNYAGDASLRGSHFNCGFSRCECKNMYDRNWVLGIRF